MQRIPSTFKPLVSIIIPTFNYGHYISITLESIREQTYQHWECIVVDDGSTDNTKEIVQTYSIADPRIKYIHQQNQYQAVAKNTGLKNCKGKYIQFLDADDLLEPRKIEYQVEFLEVHNEIEITYTDTRYFPTHDPSARWYFMNENDAPWIPQINGKGLSIIKKMITDNFLTINSPLIRRSVFEDVGYFDETLKLVEDWDFWIRATLIGKHIEFKSWDSSFALVRSHSSSFSRNRSQVNASTILMREKFSRLIEDNEALLLNQYLLEELNEWVKKVELVKQDLKEFIQEKQAFILVDEDQLRGELLHFEAIPFMQKDGEYFGLPPDDQAAITELEDLRVSDVQYIVIAWPAFWWIDYYSNFYDHLSSNYPLSFKNERLIAFELAGRERQ